jgi:hypothetical protein
MRLGLFAKKMRCESLDQRKNFGPVSRNCNTGGCRSRGDLLSRQQIPDPVFVRQHRQRCGQDLRDPVMVNTLRSPERTESPRRSRTASASNLSAMAQDLLRRVRMFHPRIESHGESVGARRCRCGQGDCYAQSASRHSRFCLFHPAAFYFLGWARVTIKCAKQASVLQDGTLPIMRAAMSAGSVAMDSKAVLGSHFVGANGTYFSTRFLRPRICRSGKGNGEYRSEC